MSNSSLITGTNLSPNYSSDRITVNRITIHHTATGPITAKRIGEIFQNKNRQASCNYGIGYDGSIYLIVEEKNRAWTSSNRENDKRSITYEVSDAAYGEPWQITQKSYESVIALSADICKRYGKTRVIEISDDIAKIEAQINAEISAGTLAKGKYNTERVKRETAYANNYAVPADAILLTQHYYFTTTSCPATYIKSKWKQICADINARLSGVTPSEDAPEVALPVVRKGTKGDNALLLQMDLNYLGYKGADGNTLDEDGVIGVNSLYALKAWQTANGLVVDGSYGPKSYAKMRTLLE